ncbi:MAG: DUF459 domain-containing protein [Deltaproteobacteria bacterium]|jgi:S-formylglutathione hydrolase FrmB|nr:DUF459 domain-containing protein [Deltaproteobacteria bacterium]
MRFKRQGLTPKRIILAYVLAMILVLGHEASRLADWLADLGGSEDGTGRALALNLAADLKHGAQETGIVALNQAEERLARRLTPTLEVGAVAAKPKMKPVLAPYGPANLAADPAQKAAYVGPGQMANQANQANQAIQAIPAGYADSAGPADPAELPAPKDPATPAGAAQSALLEIPLAAEPAKPVYHSVLLTGDSMMLEGLGPPLQKMLAKMEGLSVSRAGKYATGLCRLDVFDWIKYFEELLAEKDPDLVAISIGANDTQDIVDHDGRRHRVATESWGAIYGQRVAEILRLAAEKPAQVIWVGLPIMGQEPYNARAAAINEVAAAACQKADNCRFFDAWEILAEEGQFATFLKLGDKNQRVRAKDKIHLTEAGGRVMAEAFLTFAQSFAVLGHPPKDAATESAIQSASVVAGPAEARAIIDDPALAAKATAATPAQAIFPPKNPPDPAASEPALSQSPAASDSALSQIPAATDSALSQSPAANEPALSLSPAASEPAPKAGSPEPEGAAASPKGGQAPLAALAEASFKSKALGREVKYLVFAPKGQGPFPTVFLLPGVGENYKVWDERFGADLFNEAERLGLGLIMIDSGDDGWYLDSPIKPASKHETHFFQELLPHALTKFPLDPDRLALLGVSMGGHGALGFALAQPGRFKAVSALSAVLDLTSHGDDRAINRFLGLKPLLGAYPNRADLWRAASVYWRTRSQPEALSQTTVYLTVGRSDALALADNRQYSRLLTELEIPHLYREDSGGHDWGLWTRELPDHLAFLADRLK